MTNLARIHHAQKDLPQARHLYERARGLMIENVQAVQEFNDRTLRSTWKKQVRGLEDYLKALALLAKEASDSPSVISDAFVVSEQARGWVVQRAISRAMAQVKAENADQLLLMQRVEEFRQRRQDLWSQLSLLYGAPIGHGEQEGVAAIKKDLQFLKATL